MDANLIFEAFKFMVLGMTTVFLFLILMVFVLKVQANIVNRYFLKKSETQSKQISSKKVTNTQDDTSLIVAITAAIAEFKKKN